MLAYGLDAQEAKILAARQAPVAAPDVLASLLDDADDPEAVLLLTKLNCC